MVETAFDLEQFAVVRLRDGVVAVRTRAAGPFRGYVGRRWEGSGAGGGCWNMRNWSRLLGAVRTYLVHAARLPRHGTGAQRARWPKVAVASGAICKPRIVQNASFEPSMQSENWTGIGIRNGIQHEYDHELVVVRCK
jgi:hypothetical protein